MTTLSACPRSRRYATPPTLCVDKLGHSKLLVQQLTSACCTVLGQAGRRFNQPFEGYLQQSGARCCGPGVNKIGLRWSKTTYVLPWLGPATSSGAFVQAHFLCVKFLLEESRSESALYPAHQNCMQPMLLQLNGLPILVPCLSYACIHADHHPSVLLPCPPHLHTAYAFASICASEISFIDHVVP